MDSSRPIVFFADDDPDDRHILGFAFGEVSKGEIAFRDFSSGGSLLKALEEEVPDVVILDYHFPLETGLEVTQSIRSKNLSKQPKILIWSASASQQEALACMEAGANWFMSKPSGYVPIKTQLQKVIDYWLSASDR